MIEIVKKNREYVVIYKPAGVPSQPDPSGDPDAMSMTSELLSRLGEGSALWLVHRLDRTVGGLIVFARSKAAAAELSGQVADGKMEKQYVAVAEGAPEGGTYRDYIYKDARISKAFVVNGDRRGVKAASLDCMPIATRQERTLCRIILHTGRYHQIRVQLSSRGNPLVGDGKYGSRDRGSHTPSLFAYKLAFSIGGERVEAEMLPDLAEYPWNLFEAELTAKELL